jgi:predicted O-methyltransferase YrrM
MHIKKMKDSISKVLEELEIQSRLEKTRKVDIPQQDRMLAITKETGELLSMILRLKNAKNMLEVGTSTGYSTIWCAEAISEKQLNKIRIKLKEQMRIFKKQSYQISSQ